MLLSLQLVEFLTAIQLHVFKFRETDFNNYLLCWVLSITQLSNEAVFLSDCLSVCMTDGRQNWPYTFTSAWSKFQFAFCRHLGNLQKVTLTCYSVDFKVPVGLIYCNSIMKVKTSCNFTFRKVVHNLEESYSLLAN